MKPFRELVATFYLILLCTFSSLAQEQVDTRITNRIRDEGFNRSQVMDLASMMTDVFGPRYSNSPSYNESARWAVKKFREFGINAELEPYGEVGIGWENKFTSAHMHEPQYMTLTAYPLPYSRGTGGKVIADAIHINTNEIHSKTDLEKFEGKLKGKIILFAPKRDLKPDFNPQAARLSDQELDGMAELHILPQEDNRQSRYSESTDNQLSIEEIFGFFEKEGAAVLVRPGESQAGAPMAKGIVTVNSGPPLALDAPRPMPHLIIAVEHYNRMIRILEKGIDVKMEVEVRVEFDEDDLLDYNVIAEIPGTDLKDEYVLIGGHYDGESAATGATDNAAGCAAVMEAMRILKATGVKPRRTIRAALWGCEEAGHLGSKAYVKKYLADVDTGKKLTDYDNLSAYFNMDWYGRFRGIYLQGNDLVRPIFEEWMKPFHDVGMTHLVPGNTGGTDHMQFVRVGLPGFQFVQDDLEFFTTTFHTNMDFYDRLVEEDLIQASVILASFAYNAAMRDEKLPRTESQRENNRRWHK